MSSVRRGPAAAAPQTVPAAAPGGVAPPGLPEGVVAHTQRALQAVLDAVRWPVTRLVRSVAERLTTQPRTVSLATLETEVRDTVLALGRDLLAELVRLRGTGSRGPAYVCPCGVRLVLKELAPLQQRTWFGPITLERAVYAGPGCRVRAHHVPLDAEWALLGTAAAPAAAALPDPDGGALAAAPPGPGPARLAPAFAAVVAEFGARLPYAEAARLLEAAGGPAAHLSPTTVGAYTQAAGRARAQQEDARRVRPRPPTRAERRAVLAQPPQAPPAGAPATLVISMDGALERTDRGWKEVKLGALYDLVRRGPEGAPAPGAITYTATLAAAEAFGRQLMAAAQRRGLGWARQVVVLGDGAKWIWKLAARRFPRAVQVVDWYHAREHLWALAQLLYGEGTAAAWTWLETLAGVLWTAQTPADVALLAPAAEEAWTGRPAAPGAAPPRRTRRRRREVDKALAYFASNAPRLCYGAFRAQGLPVGSGVVEGGCRSVLHVRLKRPGARWTAAAAEHMARARAVLCSDPAPACPHPWDRLAS